MNFDKLFIYHFTSQLTNILTRSRADSFFYKLVINDLKELRLIFFSAQMAKKLPSMHFGNKKYHTKNNTDLM